MTLKNIIRSFFLQQSKKEYFHISALEQQILTRVKDEQNLETELDKLFNPPKKSFIFFQIPLAFALVLIIVVSLSVAVNPQVAASGSIFGILSDLKKQLQQQLSYLLSNDPSYRDKASQKYKQAQREWCLASARPAEEQEKAVVAIRLFLDQPKADVEFECVRNPDDNSNQSKTTESYLVENYRFVIDTETNYVVEFSPLSEFVRTSKQDNFATKTVVEDLLASIDQAEKKVRQFIAQKELAIGKIDLAPLTVEKSKTFSDEKTNYVFIWKGKSQKQKIDQPYKTCSLDIKTADVDSYDANGIPCVDISETIITPQLSVVVDQNGEIIHFANELGAHSDI